MAEHPITPPPERFKQWEDDILNERDNVDHVLDCAWKDGFRAGADQELEACCEVLHQHDRAYLLPSQLRAARRRKPPTLKEQALEQLECIQTDLNKFGMGISTDTIRRALEALPE